MLILFFPTFRAYCMWPPCIATLLADIQFINQHQLSLASELQHITLPRSANAKVWWQCLRSAHSVRDDSKTRRPQTHAPVTSLAAAPMADNYGRRITLRSGAITFTIGGAFQTFCNSYTTMVIGRVISGFGVGMLSMVVPIYQASHPAELPHRANMYSLRSPLQTM